ncbi:TPR repeat-containing protein [Syntrophus gentianae]|uniref:TPR repeat-containing protein n=1 Tax=Syntrophus gentianae TaxID=43775 RepID=A0A1H8AN24_9BACT|nr:tetratricopeptide repeat protein [Syntrophus gentianae]SEM71953.1 TPR repeat-containing protein [Syntrophus gentianae]
MLNKFYGSTMVLAATALLFASLSLTGCEKAQDVKGKAEVQKQEAPAPAPAAPAAPQPGASTQAPTASADASFEVKSHIKQGLSYVSTAKNAHNKALFDENIENALKEFSLAIEKAPDYADAYSNRGVAYMQQRKFNKALEDLKKAKELKADSPSIRYNLACLYSLKGDVDFGLDELDASLTNGFSDYESLRKDPDLNNLRKHPEFKKVLEKHKVFIVK